jgi:hypothetical protein
LEGDVVPDHLKYTIDEELFLQKTIQTEGRHCFLFATETNIRLLEESEFWIADGTFQTVPNRFCSL